MEKHANIKKSKQKCLLIFILAQVTNFVFLLICILAQPSISGLLGGVGICTFLCVCDTISYILEIQNITDIYINGRDVSFLKLNGEFINVGLEQIMEVKYGLLGGYIFILTNGEKLKSNSNIADVVVHTNNDTHIGIIVSDFPYADYEKGM